jgi:hypothetical protein
MDIVVASCLKNKMKFVTLISTIISIRKMTNENIYIGFDGIGIKEIDDLLNLPNEILEILEKKKIYYLLINHYVMYKGEKYQIINYIKKRDSFTLSNNSEKIANLKFKDFKYIGCGDITNINFFNHDNGLGYTFNNGRSLCSNNFILLIEDDWIITEPEYLKEKLYKILDLVKDKNTIVDLYLGPYKEYFGKKIKINVKEDKENEIIEYTPVDNKFYKFTYSNHPHIITKDFDYQYSENVSPYKCETTYATDIFKRKYPIIFHKHPIIKKFTMHIGGDFSYRL